MILNFLKKQKNSTYAALFCAVILLGLLAFGITHNFNSSAASAESLYSEIMKSVHNQNTDAAQACVANELQYETIEHSLIDTWHSTWISKDTKGFDDLFATGAKSAGMLGIQSSPWRDVGGIAEYKWQDGSVSWDEYLDSFTSISDVTFTGESALPSVKNPGGMIIALRFDVRGMSKDKQVDSRREDRGIFSVEVVPEGATWKIKSITGIVGDTLIASRKPSFEDVTKQVGLANVPIYTRTEAIRRGGYALSVGNLLGSGQQSIYVGAREKGTFWTKNDNGVFVQDTTQAFTDDTLVKTALFADFENKGKESLVTVRFTPQHAADLGMYAPNASGALVAKNDFIKNRTSSHYAMPAAIGDFNADSFLDLYVGFPGERDFTTVNYPGVPQDGKEVQGLFINNKDGNFTDATASSGISVAAVDNLAQLYPHSSMAYDVNRDGKDDIIVIDDRGNLGPVYLNDGNGKFSEAGEKIGLGFNALGMSVAAGDTKSDGHTDFVMSYVNFAAATRIANSCTGKIPEVVQGMAGGGIRFFANDGTNNHYTDGTVPAGLEWAGEGGAGVEFLDYNNDGYPDLFVSNGLWSGTDRTQDISGLFALSTISGVTSVDTVDSLGLIKNNPKLWLDFLSTFKGDVQTGVYNSNGPTPSMAGYQHKRLFRNNGDGTFTEVGYFEGVDSIADGYIAARADVNNDGKVDLVLRNGDPGTEAYTYPVVQIFKNTTTNTHSLDVTVRGNPEKGSNLDGIGAQVTVEVGGKTEYQELVSNNGPSQSQRTLFFGLGSATSASRVTVRFPSGQTRVYTNVKEGTLLAAE